LYLCSSCDISCYTCNGPNSNECTSCSPGTFLHNNECHSNCPTQYCYFFKKKKLNNNLK